MLHGRIAKCFMPMSSAAIHASKVQLSARGAENTFSFCGITESDVIFQLHRPACPPEPADSGAGMGNTAFPINTRCDTEMIRTKDHIIDGRRPRNGVADTHSTSRPQVDLQMSLRCLYHACYRPALDASKLHQSGTAQASLFIARMSLFPDRRSSAGGCHRLGLGR